MDHLTELSEKGFCVMPQVVDSIQCPDVVAGIKKMEADLRAELSKDELLYLDGDGPATICMPFYHNPQLFLLFLKKSAFCRFVGRFLKRLSFC